MLMKKAVILDIAAYLISLLFYGLTISFAAGLVLGTAVLFAMLYLLRLSVCRAADDAIRYGTTSQKRYMLYYALRILVFGIAFAGALHFRNQVSPVAAVIPMIYPRLIYTADAIFKKKSSIADRKKR
ncbi:MAG: ATP synthase subunit I [Oscillospiraceae bacterium]|nr:ATP synthase subunit I [Oscillospiraceae bacterium]